MDIYLINKNFDYVIKLCYNIFPTKKGGNKMFSIDNILYQKPILIRKVKIGDIEQRIYLEKTFFKANQKDQYFLKLYSCLPTGTLICQGYIYFYLDFITKESKYIGMFIKPENRGLGLASLLIASWIELCAENNFYNFTTNLRQRKPFLIYLLKKFSFEIEDKAKYKTSLSTIHICRDPKSPDKCLLFESPTYQASFAQGSIMKNDNYRILDSLTPDITVLDDVLLSTQYNLTDEQEAYNRVRTILKK